MVLYGQKTLKSIIQKNLSKSQKFARKVTLAEFRYSQTNFFTVRSNFTYDSEAYDLIETLFGNFTFRVWSKNCVGASLWKILLTYCSS